MKTLLCPSCNQTVEYAPIRKFYNKAIKQEYHLFHCHKCGLMFWGPLGLLPELYENEAFGYFDQHYQMRIGLPDYCKVFFDKIPLKEGLLLDVGGAEGLFALEAQKRGFDVYLIDFDKKSVNIARGKGVKNAFAVSLEEFVNYCIDNHLLFDVVTLFEVVEHQDNLNAFVHNIKKILKSNGWIAGSTPNRERTFAEWLRRMDGQDVPPHHFFWWDKKSLQYFFMLHNFTLEICPTRVNLQYATAQLIDLIMGEHIRKIKKTILNGQPDTTNAQRAKISFMQKTMLNFMRYSRHFCLLPFGIFLRIIWNKEGGISFYFQGQLLQ